MNHEWCRMNFEADHFIAAVAIEANIENSVNHLSTTRTFALGAKVEPTSCLDNGRVKSLVMLHWSVWSVISQFLKQNMFFFKSFLWMCLIKLQWPHGTKKHTTLHIEVHAFWMVRNLGLSEVKRRAKEKIQKIAPRCTKPDSKPQMAIYHDVYHDVSTAYLQCILCTPKWFEVHQNILKTQAAQAWGTDQKDQTHWTRIHAYGILWLQMMLAHCSGSANLSTSPGCQKLVGQISAWDNVDQ